LEFTPIYNALVNGVRNTPAFTTIHALLAYLKNQYTATPTLKALIADPIFKLTLAENIDAEHADEYEQSTAKTITLGGPPGTLTFGAHYTTLPTDGTNVTTYSAGTVKAGQPLATDILFDHGIFGNRLDEYVFFKFTVTSERTHFISVTPINNPVSSQIGVFMTLNDHGAFTSNSSTSFNATQTISKILKPGNYTLAVRTIERFATPTGPRDLPGASGLRVRIQ
jgi:hypothetical protein